MLLVLFEQMAVGFLSVLRWMRGILLHSSIPYPFLSSGQKNGDGILVV